MAENPQINPEDEPEDFAALSREEYLVYRLNSMHKFMCAEMTKGSKTNSTLISKLETETTNIRNLLDELREAKSAAESAETDPTTWALEDYLDRMRAALKLWPNEYLETAIDVYCERHSLTVSYQEAERENTLTKKKLED